MFGALIKAFTGRAGWLAGLLALLIAVVVIYAAVKGTPRIGQSLISDAQTILQSNMVNDEPLAKIRAEGRDLFIEGQLQDATALKTKLQALDGVRRVIVDSADTTANTAATVAPVQSAESKADTTEAEVEEQVVEGGQTAQTAVNSEAAQINTTAVGNAQENSTGTATLNSEGSASVSPSSTDLVRNDGSTDSSVDQSSEEGGNTNGDANTQINLDTSDSQAADQSSLSLRYDGTKLKLTGHVGDDQLAALISQEVRNAMPQFSELESNVNGQGGISGLNWMNQFLDAVANLPGDAQGVINGSDLAGVQILPDTEQTLLSTPQNKQLIEQEDGEELVPNVDKEAAPVIEVEQANANDQAATEEPTANLQENAVEADQDQDVSTDSNETSSEQNVAAMEAPREGAEQIKTDIQSELIENENPADFILNLNRRMAQKPIFASGDIEISEELAAELDQLAQIMNRYPELFLRIVGNLDFSVGPRDAEYVGVDRAREIRDYVRAQGVERFRVFSAPLPRDYAFDKQVQVVFYISE